MYLCKLTATGCNLWYGSENFILKETGSKKQNLEHFKMLLLYIILENVV